MADKDQSTSYEVPIDAHGLSSPFPRPIYVATLVSSGLPMYLCKSNWCANKQVGRCDASHAGRVVKSAS